MKNFLSVRILKFGAVGLSGMVIDFFVTWLLKEKCRLNKYIANSAGFSLAVISNFVLNNTWTFNAPHEGTGKRFMMFIAIAMCGLIISNISLWLLSKYLTVNFYILKLFVIGIVFFWNYFLNAFFTFV